jgi:hypothetical protein
MKTVIWLVALAMCVQLNCLAAESVNVRVSITIPELPKITENKEKDNTSAPENQNEPPIAESETTTLALCDDRQVLLVTRVVR